MEAIDFTRMFAEAKAALEAVDAQIANLEEALGKVRDEREAALKIYNASAPFVGEAQIPTMADRIVPPLNSASLKVAGISVAIRSLLDTRPQENFTAAQMRDLLATNGWDWEGYKNPLSTVHTTMVRLEQSGHAKAGRTDGKKCFYSATRADNVKAADLSKAIASLASPSFADVLMKNNPFQVDSMFGAWAAKTPTKKK